MTTTPTRARALNDNSLYACLQAKQPPEYPELAKLREVTRTMPRGRMQIAPAQGISWPCDARPQQQDRRR